MIVFKDDKEFKKALRAANKFTANTRDDLDYIKITYGKNSIELNAIDGFSGINRKLDVIAEEDESSSTTLYLHNAWIPALPNQIEAIQFVDDYMEVYEVADKPTNIKIPVQNEGHNFDISKFVETAKDNAYKISLDPKRLKKFAEGLTDLDRVVLYVSDININPIAIMDPDNEDSFAILLPLRP